MSKKQETPVEKIVRSKRAGGLKTGMGFFSTEMDEVLVVSFKNLLEYHKLLRLRTFVPATESELQQYMARAIPVVQEDTDLTAPPPVVPAVKDKNIVFNAVTNKFPQTPVAKTQKSTTTGVSTKAAPVASQPANQPPAAVETGQAENKSVDEIPSRRRGRE
jgi:hypothetical protein